MNMIYKELDVGIDWSNVHSCSQFLGTGIRLTNQIVIALEQFRKKEHVKHDFASEWLNVLGEGIEMF